MRRRNRFGSFVVAAVAAVGFLLSASPATAGNQELESVLGEIEWGDTKSEVLNKLKKQRLRKLRKRKDLKHDRVKMQRARKRAMQKHERVEETYTKLEGDDAGYRVSVIADEFTRDNNEALLKVKDEAAQRFYFFVDGAFYKLVVAYKEGHLEGVGFKSFVGQVAKKYGSPDKTKTREINGEKKMARALWKSPTTILKAKNQREFFGTFSLVFTDRQRIKQMKAENEQLGGSEKTSAQISNRVEDLKKGSKDDANADVVDDMVGEKVNLDMKRDAKLEEQGPEAKEAREGGDEEGGDEKVAGSQKSSGSQGSSSSGSQQESSDDDEDREFDNLGAGDDKEEEDDDELIVY